MQAAEALLLEGGTAALSAGAVAERAKVNKALIFYYFGSVDALVADVLERYYARHREALEAAFDRPEEDDLERLRAFIDIYFDWMKEHRAYARIVQQQVSTGGVHSKLASVHLTALLRITEARLAELLPARGPLSAKHFHLSLSAMVINYFTYAPMFWGSDPLSKRALEERRTHLHFTVDAWLAALPATRSRAADRSGRASGTSRTRRPAKAARSTPGPGRSSPRPR